MINNNEGFQIWLTIDIIRNLGLGSSVELKSPNPSSSNVLFSPFLPSKVETMVNQQYSIDELMRLRAQRTRSTVLPPNPDIGEKAGQNPFLGTLLTATSS